MYRAFAQGDCDGLQAYLGGGEGQQVGEFGRAMVAVCAAAVQGRQDQWAVAQAAAGADPSGLHNDCVAGVVKALLDRALDWHRRHPGQRPDVRLQRVAGQTACGRQDSAATDTDETATTETTETTATTQATGTSDTTGTTTEPTAGG